MTPPGIAALADQLRTSAAPKGCANPYAIFEPGIDATPDAPAIRTAQLVSYLARRLERAEMLLIAEAPGYQGARFSGIAMTCERTLLGRKPGVAAGLVLRPADRGRRTSAVSAARNAPESRGGFSEPTATVVWGELALRGATDRAVLWNVFPFHPRRPGEPLTNRTPSRTEVHAALGVIEALLGLFPGRRILAIGNTARDHLAPLGLRCEALRHPANGGVPRFRAGLAAILGDA